MLKYNIIKFPIRFTGLQVDDSNLKHIREEFNENTNRTPILICVPTHCTMQRDILNLREHKLIMNTSVLKQSGEENV
jgi:hypothetical protein